MHFRHPSALNRRYSRVIEDVMSSHYHYWSSSRLRPRSPLQHLVGGQTQCRIDFGLTKAPRNIVWPRQTYPCSLREGCWRMRLGIHGACYGMLGWISDDTDALRGGTDAIRRRGYRWWCGGHGGVRRNGMGSCFGWDAGRKVSCLTP